MRTSKREFLKHLGFHYSKSSLMNNNTPAAEVQLKEDIKAQIETEGTYYANLNIGDLAKFPSNDLHMANKWDEAKESYIAGATAWAIWKQKYDELKARSAVWVKGAPKVQEPHYAKVPSKIFDDLVYNAIIIPKGINERWWAVGDGFSIDVASEEIIAYLDELGATDLQAKYESAKADFERVQKSAIHYANRKDEVEKQRDDWKAKYDELNERYIGLEQSFRNIPENLVVTMDNYAALKEKADKMEVALKEAKEHIRFADRHTDTHTFMVESYGNSYLSAIERIDEALAWKGEGEKELPPDAVAFLKWVIENEYTYNSHGGGYWYELNEKEQETYLCDTVDELYGLFKGEKEVDNE